MIEEKRYRTILEQIPIATVDAVVCFGRKFLLMKRNNAPVRGEWWVPGGRVWKGETLEAAVKREVLEETGLDCEIVRRVGVLNQIFPECHTISIYFLVRAPSPDVKLNAEHSAYRWSTRLPRGCHPYLREIVENACAGK